MAELKLGDTLKCLKCKNEFELTKDTFLLLPTAEVVYCPHCKAKIDTFAYLMDMAERKKREDVPVVTKQKIGLLCGRWTMTIEYTIGDEERSVSMFLE